LGGQNRQSGGQNQQMSGQNQQQKQQEAKEPMKRFFFRIKNRI